MVQLNKLLDIKAKKSFLSSLCLGLGILTQISSPAFAQDEDQIANGQWFDSNSFRDPEFNRNPSYLLTLDRLEDLTLRLEAANVGVEPVLLVIDRTRGTTFEIFGNGNVAEFNGFLFEGEYIVIAATEDPNEVSQFTISTTEGDFDGLHVEHRTVDTQGEEDEYYEEIDPNDEKLTLDDWLEENGFNDNGAQVLVASYYNNGDLGLGRDLFCVEDGSFAACCSANFGTPGKDDAIEALQAIRDGDTPAATVCMESNSRARTNKVNFWVYGGDGQRLNFLQLDNQEGKSVPGVCLNCHGGEYDDDDANVEGSRFLPFNIDNFEFANEDFSEGAQSEQLRELNALVARVEEDREPGNIITRYINEIYGGDVERRGAVWDKTYVPEAWKNAGQSMQWTYVIKKYCVDCHMGIDIPFNDLGQINQAQFEDFICGYNPEGPIMPHAEHSDAEFWDDETAVRYAVSDYDDCMDWRFGQN